MATMQVEIVSAEKGIFSGEAEMLVAPTINGEVGIMPRHTQMLVQLGAGEARLKLPNQTEEETIFVAGGILEVQPHVVTVLSDTAERAADLDEAAALAAKQAAEDAIADRDDKIDMAKAQAELAEAIARVQLIEKLKQRK